MIKYLLLLLGYAIGMAIGYFFAAVVVDIIGNISRMRKERKKKK